jgi:hypothetical protein
MKACIIYLASLKVEADAVAAKLAVEGYTNCLEEVEAAVADAILHDVAAIPRRISDCLKDADCCVLLLGQDETDEAMGAIGGVASDGGCRVVAVSDQVADNIAKSVDAFIDAIVPCDLEDLIDIVKGKDHWPADAGGKEVQREIRRVKCQ